jgi:hypothetical protein
MSDKSKFYYLFTNEGLSIINIFGNCIECLTLNILLFQLYRIRIRIFIIPINGPTIGANKLHTLIIVIGGNYTYTGYLIQR